MNISTHNINPGRWYAVDADTYDGTSDGNGTIGTGATEAGAIADLIEQLEDME